MKPKNKQKKGFYRAVFVCMAAALLIFAAVCYSQAPYDQEISLSAGYAEPFAAYGLLRVKRVIDLDETNFMVDPAGLSVLNNISITGDLTMDNTIYSQDGRFYIKLNYHDGLFPPASVYINSLMTDSKIIMSAPTPSSPTSPDELPVEGKHVYGYPTQPEWGSAYIEPPPPVEPPEEEPPPGEVEEDPIEFEDVPEDATEPEPSDPPENWDAIDEPDWWPEEWPWPPPADTFYESMYVAVEYDGYLDREPPWPDVPYAERYNWDPGDVDPPLWWPDEWLAYWDSIDYTYWWPDWWPWPPPENSIYEWIFWDWVAAGCPEILPEDFIVKREEDVFRELNLSAYKFADVSEGVRAGNARPGDVVVIDAENDLSFLRSAQGFDPRVAGVISADPKLILGQAPHLKPLALAGIVKCRVTAENGPVKRGDMLVTSSMPGHAMRAEPADVLPGMVVGKALEPLAQGTGLIYILVNKK